ncbi:MAG: metallophosphoesterase [Proteobacteria bacterium]|nr:metallophosphoesterase [Pseudomonadota bacterium]MCP4917521.1 metallophosphoesterase [Pseudomonadota bacterium]
MIWFLLACARPECSRPHYDRPECRVQAASELARLVTSDGVDVRFQDPLAEDATSWDSRGVVRQASDGSVYARVATLGDFALTLEGEVGSEVYLIVDNVDPRMPELDGEYDREGLRRLLHIELSSEPAFIVGTMPAETCDTPQRYAVTADIQTNPIHFRRLVTALHDEVAASEAAGETLLGLVLLGDITEHSLQAELDEVVTILRTSPVPVAVVPGNHDVYDSVDAVFNRTFGPGNMAFAICDTRMVLLDTGNGGLAASIRGRLPELLGDGEGVLLAGMHHPPLPGQTSGGWTFEDQADQLLVELAVRDADLVMAGHVHLRDERHEGPVPEVVIGTAGADQYAVTPDYGYLRVTTDTSADWCFVPVPVPGSEGSPRPDATPALCR